MSVYRVFLNVSQHNLEQKHHGAGAGAATASCCSTQQQHRQSQSPRSAGLVSSPPTVIPPWHPAFMSSLSTKMKTRAGWHFFPPPQNQAYPIHSFYRGTISMALPVPASQQGGNTAPKGGRVILDSSVHIFLQRK